MGPPRRSAAFAVARARRLDAPSPNDSTGSTTPSCVRQSETSLAFNWFIQGHNNKVTADISHYRFEEPPDASDDGTRFRLQWDISL